jgi:DNA-binding response OmpR family regulator
VRETKPTEKLAKIESARELPTVLVLCAEQELRHMLIYWLTSLSARTFAAADGYEANIILKAMDSGLLITDRALPPWPGLDTFRQLQSVNARLRIALVDDGSLDGTLVARVTGANIVLTRPLSRRQVLGALDRSEFMP